MNRWVADDLATLDLASAAASDTLRPLGRHACLGEPYAKPTTQLVVGSILRYVQFVPSGSGGARTHAGITLTSEPPPVVTFKSLWGVES